MPKEENLSETDMNNLCLKINLKFREITHVNHKLDKYLINNYDNLQIIEINDLFDKLEETEYYFDELIYLYDEIKPLIKQARIMKYKINK
jgi:hypothetical protein